MTVTIICEKTGLQFEAENRRRKSHPVVMSWMETAYKEGWYEQANATIYGSRYTEKQSFTTIEQFVSYFQDLQQRALHVKREADASEVQRKRDAEEAKRQRYILNRFLNDHGYSWKKFENDEEDQDFFKAPEFEWYLRDEKTQQSTTVKEAMIAIARASGDQFAHAWLAERGIEIPVEMPEAPQEEAVEPTYNDEQIAYQQEAIPALLEAGLAPEVAVREAKRFSLPHSPQEDAVRLKPVSLRHIVATLVINSDFRYGVLVAGRWHGIDEILAEYPELSGQLAQYAERNKKNAQR